MAPKSSRIAWGVLAAATAAVLVYFFWPRQANLRGFDPAAVARAETGMWRDYYDHHYASLFRRLYGLSRDEYHFSPWDSARLSWYAATSARAFQPTTSRAEAQRARPILERYYGIIRRHGGEVFDVAQAARLELEWWQMRRDGADSERYGEVVAQVSAEVYGVNGAEMKQAAVLRAEMMRYRDAHRNGRMQPADWIHIE